MSIKVSLCVDAAHVEACPVHTDGDRPYLFVDIDTLSLWSHESAAFRRLAATFMEAADTLDAAKTEGGAR